MSGTNDYLDSYCYGPADILRVCPGNSSLWLNLVDSTGHQGWAVYQDCIYRQVSCRQSGLHLSLVRRVEPWELQMPSITDSLRKNSDHVQQLLKAWKQQGYSFFLHIGSRQDSDFLVVAKRLEFF